MIYKMEENEGFKTTDNKILAQTSLIFILISKLFILKIKKS